MLKRIFGRKKYGKTTYCVERIKECVDSKKKCYYIVPEQFTFACEKMVTSVIGNKANLYVVFHNESKCQKKIYLSKS